MTTSASGRSRSAGIRASSVKARKTAVPVAAATPLLATRPSSASAPITVSRSPPPPGHLADGAPSPGGAGVGPRHPGVDAGLVDEHEAGGVDPGQLGAPRPPRLGHVLAVLLGGLDGLFFRTRPSAFSARHRAEALRRTPVRSASRSAYSARV